MTTTKSPTFARPARRGQTRSGSAASADSLVLAGRLEFGQTNGVVQIWAYPDEEYRARALAVEGVGATRPADCPAPLSTVVKRLAPAGFSPLQ